MAIELMPRTIALKRNMLGRLIPPFLAGSDSPPAEPIITADPLSSTANRIALTSATGADTVRLDASLDGATWMQLTAAMGSTYDHTGLTAEVLRYYRPTAVNNKGETVGGVVSATTSAAAGPTPVESLPPDAPLARVDISAGEVKIQEDVEHPQASAHSTTLTIEKSASVDGPWETQATNATLPFKTAALAKGELAFIRLVDPANANAVYGPVSVKRPADGPNQIRVDVLSHHQVAVHLEQWSGKTLELRESIDGGATWYLSAICHVTFPKIIHDLVPGRTYTWDVIERATQGQVTAGSGATIVYGEASNSVSATLPAAPTQPFADDQIITLTGLNFGSLPDVRYSGRDDFDYTGQVAVGERVPQSDFGDVGALWTGVGGSSAGEAPYLFSDHRAIGNRQYGALAQSIKGLISNLQQTPDNAARKVETAYMSWFFRTNTEMLSTVAGSSGSDKFCRVWQEGNTSTHISWTWQHFTFAGDAGVDNYVSGISPINDKGRHQAAKYHRLELWINGGELHATIDGVTCINNNGLGHFTTLERTSPTAPWYLAQVGQDISIIDNIDLTLRNGITDVVERPSAMRIEVSERSTWTSEYPNYHKRYEQPLVSWADGEIRFKVFNGHLNPDKPRYVYIIQPDGSVNQNGYPLTGTTIDVGTWSAI